MTRDQSIHPEPVHACLVITRSHLAYARVAASSFLAHNPGSQMTALLIDDVEHVIADSDLLCHVVRPDDVFLNRQEFHRMAMMYTATELATAMKPALLKHLLRSGASEAVYLDADVWVGASLGDVVPLAREHSIVLTPHFTEPATLDLELPLLLNGVFNTGFVAAGQGAGRFLDWWSDRLARHCLLDRHRGLFNEQSWVDFVPSLFNHHVLRDPAWNVGPWNVDVRKLEWCEGRYLVNGEPLRFFHFSGFDPQRPYVLARWFGPVLPILISEHPGLGRLCREYTEALFAAGYLESAGTRYGYSFLPDGTPIEPADRRLYREALLAAEKSGGTEPPNPFEDGSQPFLELLRQERGDRLAMRPALSRSPSAERFEWPEVLQPGVNLVVERPSQGAPAAVERAMTAGLERLGVSHSSIEVARTAELLGDPFEKTGAEAVRHDTTIICLPPIDVPAFAFWTPGHFFADRYSIGVWSSLGSDENALSQSLLLLDEVWLESTEAAEKLASRAERPIFPLALPVELGKPDALSRRELGLPEGFLFLTIVDVSQGLQLGRTLALIEAFTLAFSLGTEWGLVVRGVTKDHRTVELERLRLATQRPEVHIAGGPLDSAARVALIQACDCYVSVQTAAEPEHALAEAMALAKPVVAFPKSSSSLLDGLSAFVVPEADSELVANVSSTLRRVVQSPLESAEKAHVARERIFANRSPEALARFVEQRLSAIAATRAGRKQAEPRSTRRRDLRSVLHGRATRRQQS